MQVREGNLVDVIADLEDTLLAPNLISGTTLLGIELLRSCPKLFEP